MEILVYGGAASNEMDFDLTQDGARDELIFRRTLGSEAGCSK